MSFPYPLGRGPVRVDPRTLRFASYIDEAALPPLPDVISWATKVAQWPMMKNDTLGDCTIAAAGHLIQLWTTYARRRGPVIVSDADVIKAYSAVSGYDPVTGKNDNGAVSLDVLNYWRQTGIGGDQIVAYVAIDPKNRQHMRRAIQLFGGVYIGVALPAVAQGQITVNRPWSVVWPLNGDSTPNSWGGHAIPLVGYDQTFLQCVTWAEVQKLSWNWLYWYCDEAYVAVTVDWIDEHGLSPSGFDLQALLSDARSIAA